MGRRRLLASLLAAASVAGRRPLRAARARARASRPLLRGRLAALARRRLPEAARLLPLAHDALTAASPDETTRSSAPRSGSMPTSRVTSSSARAGARATTSTSTASRRGPTCSRRSASTSPPRSPSTSPTPPGSRGPELGAVALAAAASLASGLPFLIVRKRGQGVRHREPARRRLRAGRARLPRRGRRHLRRGAVEALEALREAGLECRIAVCVVDREEGGVDALARRGVRLVPLFRAGDLLAAQKTAAKPHG